MKLFHGRLNIVGVSLLAWLGFTLILRAETKFAGESPKGAVRLGHSPPVPGSYRLNRFEMVPFVIDAEAANPIRLLVGVEGAGAQFVSIDTSQFFGFRKEILFLEDDGFFPDEIEGDGVFTGHMVPSVPAELLGGLSFLTHELRVLELVVHGNGAIDETLQDDVAYSYGLIDSAEPDRVVEIVDGYGRTDRVLNLAQADLLVGEYPSIGVNQKRVSNEVIELLEDRFDWIVFCHVYNTRGFPASDFTSVRNSVRGIGQTLFDDSSDYGSDGVLRLVASLYRKHTDQLTHNLFHTWGVYGIEQLGMKSSVGGQGHWGALASLGQHSIFGFPATLQSLMRREDGDFCGPIAAIGEGRILDWERYLIGLIPSGALSNATILRNSVFKGFDCDGYVFQAEGIETLSSVRWIETFGERFPAYPDINRFHAAAVVVTDRPLQSVEFDFIHRMMVDHENMFAETFDQKAFLSYRLGQRHLERRIHEVELTDSGVAVRLSGPPGEFQLETSFDLSNWGRTSVDAPTGEAVFRYDTSVDNQWFIRWKQ